MQLLQTTGGIQGTLPLTVQKVLASQACHGKSLASVRILGVLSTGRGAVIVWEARCTFLLTCYRL